jgi:hypothetical protein
MQKSPNIDLYNLLVTKDFDPEILDAKGTAISDPAEAELFSFDWKTERKNYGTVVVLLGKDKDLQVFFGDNLGHGMEGADKSDWYVFLNQLKQFSTRNLLNFQLKNLNKLKYTMQGLAAIKEGLFEGYYGNKKYSYSDRTPLSPCPAVHQYIVFLNVYVFVNKFYDSWHKFKHKVVIFLFKGVFYGDSHIFNFSIISKMVRNIF